MAPFGMILPQDCSHGLQEPPGTPLAPKSHKKTHKIWKIKKKNPLPPFAPILNSWVETEWALHLTRKCAFMSHLCPKCPIYVPFMSHLCPKCSIYVPFMFHLCPPDLPPDRLHIGQVRQGCASWARNPKEFKSHLFGTNRVAIQPFCKSQTGKYTEFRRGSRQLGLPPSISPLF